MDINIQKRIGEVLVENGTISNEQLSVALKIQAREKTGPLGIILLLLHYITPRQLLESLDQQKFKFYK